MRASHRSAAPAAPDGVLVHYECYRPERTPLYRLVQQHAATFIAEKGATGADLPQFAQDVIDAFHECGILANGFQRLRCVGLVIVGHRDGAHFAAQHRAEGDRRARRCGQKVRLFARNHQTSAPMASRDRVCHAAD